MYHPLTRKKQGFGSLLVGIGVCTIGRSQCERTSTIGLELGASNLGSQLLQSGHPVTCTCAPVCLFKRLPSCVHPLTD
ncbi:hypothetical protein EVA_22241 [gut metagenome]|uniref:Uncharacterized protein n=1 Tax=gut metagenome TaxID=749906 RepID=J9F417_9ZZZZ